MSTPATKQKDISRAWQLIDAKEQILGRLASQIARVLIGKTKQYFSPNLDCGDYAVVINCDQIKLTGKKALQKTYWRHSNYPGGFKSISFGEQLKKDSCQALHWTVYKMLPKNRLRDGRINRLKAFKDDKHIYQDKIKHD